MATATEIITDVINLRYHGNFGTYDFHSTDNRTVGTVVTNYIYRIPSGKIAEVIVHTWNESPNSNYLGRLMMGHLREGVTSGGYKDLRYRESFLANNVEGTNPDTQVGLYAADGFNGLIQLKDKRYFLDENMYIFREFGGAAYFGDPNSIDLWWDITVILRNKP